MKVSIITPTKNSMGYIKECVQSVLNQANHEHIIVDGGSTDGTVEYLRRSQVRLITGTDKSAGDAWVKGMKRSTGDILGFLGADDTLEPNAIQTVIDWFNTHPSASFVFGGCNYINDAGNIIKQLQLKDFNLHDAINDHCSIPCTSAFYRKEVIEIVDPATIAMNDSELEYWLMVGKKYKIHRMDQVLSNFRIHEAKVTNNRKRENGFYTYASTVYHVNRRQGAGLFSPCARRYYLALMLKPLSPILDPIFRSMTQG